MSELRFKQATIIGSGPNGLAAAIELARSGVSVRVLEAQATIGGGTRSLELTLPGFVHDVCSAIHPLGVGSPFFRQLPLDAHGLEWIQPPAPLAHPLDDGTAVMLERSIDETCETLDAKDAKAYLNLLKPFVNDWEALVYDTLGPIGFPSHPLTTSRFAFYGLRSANSLAKSLFKGARARALFAGIAGHSLLSLDQKATASFGLMLAVMGHAVGWAIPRGGSQKIADALVSYLRSLGGEVVADSPVESIDGLLLPASAVLCDLTPRGLLKIAGHKLSAGYRIKLEKFRIGHGVFKVDWALSCPIPWKAKDAARAGTVHVGGTLEEISAAEDAPGKGRHSEKPYVLVTQPSLFDRTRAPEGKHTAWGYCHVPNGSTFDMTERIENQIERFAPGFRDCIIAKKISPPSELERRNANLLGGNISGGSQDIRQLFLRPTLRMYSTPTKGLYLCSSSTPPGGGVHGMCGYYAAASRSERLKAVKTADTREFSATMKNMAKAVSEKETGTGVETDAERVISNSLGTGIHLFLSALAVLLVIAAAIAAYDTVVRDFPALWQQQKDEYVVLQKIIGNILLIAIAAEFALLLLFHRMSAAVEVVVFVIARKTVSPEITALDLLLCAAAIAGLIVLRFYYLPGRTT